MDRSFAEGSVSKARFSDDFYRFEKNWWTRFYFDDMDSLRWFTVHFFPTGDRAESIYTECVEEDCVLCLAYDMHKIKADSEKLLGRSIQVMGGNAVLVSKSKDQDEVEATFLNRRIAVRLYEGPAGILFSKIKDVMEKQELTFEDVCRRGDIIALVEDSRIDTSKKVHKFIIRKAKERDVKAEGDLYSLEDIRKNMYRKYNRQWLLKALEYKNLGVEELVKESPDMDLDDIL